MAAAAAAAAAAARLAERRASCAAAGAPAAAVRSPGPSRTRGRPRCARAPAPGALRRAPPRALVLPPPAALTPEASVLASVAKDFAAMGLGAAVLLAGIASTDQGRAILTSGGAGTYPADDGEAGGGGAREMLCGVDVTGFEVMSHPDVRRAAEFARVAHRGQQRKTGEPYVNHCIEAARILAATVPADEVLSARAVETVVATIVHDCVDDTPVTLDELRSEFGPAVASLVSSVSRVGDVTQVLRRKRFMKELAGRAGTTSDGRGNLPTRLSQLEEGALLGMLLDMVDDPRVILIKLADRLHNCRTLWALKPSKREAVADETLVIWCSLAGRLGLFAVKAELEDLCFAVLDPVAFASVRHGLDVMWTPAGAEPPAAPEVPGADAPAEDVRAFMGLVMPFEVLNGRAGGSALEAAGARAEGVDVHLPSAAATESLHAIEGTLLRELYLRVGYVPGTEVRLYGRLKSMYSTYCKMLRKGVALAQVYDTRALRVVVGVTADTAKAAQVTCYRMLATVHRLWAPVAGEMDDYVANPKRSGYQSLHTAVIAPDGAPLEVQIRTQEMHEMAEYGDAAHFLYKESYTPEDNAAILDLDGTESAEEEDGEGASVSDAIDWLTDLDKLIGEVPSDRRGRRAEKLRKSLARRAASKDGAAASGGAVEHAVDVESGVAAQSRDAAMAQLAEGAGSKPASAQEHALSAVAAESWSGRPMLRVDRDVLLDSVTMDVLDGGNELVVATYTAGRLLEPEAAARDRWEPYARAARHAASRGLRLPGQSDSDVVLERFVLCQDGLYHRTDVYDHKSHIFLTPMQVDSEFRPMLENARAMAAGAGRSPEPVGDGVAALDGRSPDGFEGEDAAPPPESVSTEDTSRPAAAESDSAVVLANKARKLRSMLQWDIEAEMAQLSEDTNAVEAFEAAMAVEAATDAANAEDGDTSLSTTSVLMLPSGKILQVPRGADATDAAVQDLKARDELEVLPGLLAEARAKVAKTWTLVVNGTEIKADLPGPQLNPGDVVEMIPKATGPDLSVPLSSHGEYETASNRTRQQ